MSKSVLNDVLGKLGKGEITQEQAAAMLTSARKLRGVKVTDTEREAYHTLVQDGNFRAFAEIVAKGNTVAAQNALGRITRAMYEKIA